MKKIIIAAALIFATGIVASRTKENNVKPAQAVAQRTFFDSKKELASGD
jgi:hypothetical protein